MKNIHLKQLKCHINGAKFMSKAYTSYKKCLNATKSWLEKTIDQWKVAGIKTHGVRLHVPYCGWDLMTRVVCSYIS